MTQAVISERLDREKADLAAELQEALLAVVFLHGGTIEKKMQKSIYKDDYGIEIYDKFYVERDYFIKRVMLRDIPLKVWSFLIPDATPERFFTAAISVFVHPQADVASLEIPTENRLSSITKVPAGLRPINEIVQQAEMLISEVDQAMAAQWDRGAIEEDPLLNEAVAVVLRSGKASISLVQRNFKIGYNRAAGLVEQMEKLGLVSTMSTSGQREILRYSNNLPVAALRTQGNAVAEYSDVAVVRQMVEDHWRAFLLLGRQNPAAGASLIQSFDERISGYSASLSQDKAKVFLTTIEREREKLFLEYELNPDALKARLNIAVEAPQTRQARSRGQSFGEIVVRTAVRATVWEIVRSIFRR